MRTDWRHLYSSLLQENQNLKKQVEILESILRLHLPIIETNITENRRK
mgnify:CR=1 FL=1